MKKASSMKKAGLMKRMLFGSICATPLLLALSLASCRNTPTTAETDSSDSADYCVAAARREAASDLKGGRAKIYRAGTIGITEPGVADPQSKAAVADLPRSNALPAGCTDPHALQAYSYAQAYNQVVVESYLTQR